MSSKKMLIVDDNQDILSVTQIWFEDDGYDVETAESGNKALKKLANHKYDIIISDVKMPDGSGLDLLKGINENNYETNIVIIMTGYSDIDQKIFLDLGATHFYRKPVNLVRLSDFLSNVEF